MQITYISLAKFYGNKSSHLFLLLGFLKNRSS